MASNVTVQSVLGKISEGHLECTICTNRFRQPKVLDCLHSYCLECLQELRQCHNPSNTKLTCPLCRRETILERSGVADLPNNFTLSALVEEVTMQEKLLEEGKGSEIKCQACNEGNQAVSRCMDCDHFLCQECQRAHGRMTLMKSHKTYTLAQSKLAEEVPKCGKHPDQNLNVYCNTCEQVICTRCSVLQCVNHYLTGLPQALEKCKKLVEKLLTDAEKNKSKLSTAISEMEMSRFKMDTMFENNNIKITEKADKEIAKIKAEEQKLKQQVEKIYRARVETFERVQAVKSDELTQTTQKLDEVKQLVAQGSFYKILQFQQKLLHDLRQLTGEQSEAVPDMLSFIDFEEGGRTLGRLALQEERKATPGRLSPKGKWELKIKIKNVGPHQRAMNMMSRVYNFAVFSNSKIVVPFLQKNQLITFSLPKSKHELLPIPRLLQITGLRQLRYVAVFGTDQLVVLDGSAVKVFNKQHQLLHQFTPGRESHSQPTCLAVDDRNRIAVGYMKEKEISIHQPDGLLLGRLSGQMIGYCLTIYKQQLIYTSYLNQKLHSVDYNGATVFSVDLTCNSQETGNPTGVCCDSDGSIYVAVRRQPTADVLHYSPDGKYIGCTISGCGKPSDITLTSDGDLAVAAGDSIHIYHRV